MIDILLIYKSTNKKSECLEKTRHIHLIYEKQYYQYKKAICMINPHGTHVVAHSIFGELKRYDF